MTIYMWAYGSNLNVDHMRQRCPRAKAIKKMFVTEGALVFRGVADVTLRKGGMIPGGLWKISGECERTLDTYEGVRNKFYLKRYFTLEIDGVKSDCLFYQMRMSRGVMPPSEHYIETIAQGYRDFGLDLAYLDAALQESWADKKVTDTLRERHIRKGKPMLARGS